MSTWASRLSSSKSVSPTSGTESRGAAAQRDFSSVSNTASPTSMVSGGGAGADVGAGSGNAAALLREEFRVVAEAYNEQNVYLLRLPPDCWDMAAKYLSYMDVIALGQACRSLWRVLHNLDSLWRRQLSYFYHDMRDLRGGKLLCTAPLFPESPCSRSTSHQGSMGALTGPAGGQEWPRKAWHQSYMSAYERFFQERRVYVLDSHREWHFQELADVEDKSTGMFTVALHDGRVEALTAAASPLSMDPFSFSGAWSASPPQQLLPWVAAASVSATASPIFANAVDSTREWLLAAPSSPASFAASQPPASPAQAPTPLHVRTTSAQTNGTSIGSSPAIAPAAAPSTPPLLPRVGEPIINEHNPLLRLRVYAIEPVEAEENRDAEAAEVAAYASGIDEERHRSHASLASSISASLSGMTEEQVIEYVMRLSLAETQQAASRSSSSSPTAEAPSNAKPAATDPVGSATQQQPKLYRHCHYRGANPTASLPLSELLAILDAFTNNASDQLQYHHVRNCTEDEDPAFLQRLSETLRSAKHRRLHLGNHHRAVRNNGQTTRNRAGRSAGAGSADAPSLSLSAAGTATPPQQPPPMNRMLRGFHGDLLEITEREAQLVAGTLLGMPRVIDEFVAFRCYDPALLYHRLYSSSTAIDRAGTRGTPREARGEAPWLKDNSVLSDGVSPISRQTTQAGSSGPTHQSVETPAAIPPLTTLTPSLRPLPFFTRFFLAPELCHDGCIALIVVDVVRVLVIVEKEVVTTDNPDWASPLIARGGRVVVHGQGYNAQAYTRDEYNYVPLNPTRRRRNSDSGG
ncbi:conserved hypothetical protein [Leishmania infantum JPCM5]|uniref:Uncharacterized protein n=2 Tax=Leishmania infantum TaxID=5671 RepID=A4I8Y7_LEIIN|nr:conserved hypothetical protein [Leishmania infantum JPCM5]CAC9531552.1 hypothetical_protein_-_conserved [Leishmania infantum]CAM71287.1 conserved hypothetical protein [Leishmania infantum JPCM5]SUZ45131.1 hypothetical_protein_-_conserved [Leishmania infantum]|eukprot:XP_001468206.1 conserved hypothetical protein [Leishmania infantum JPCM5]